jgi:peptide/nickel transport system substrate-binding protein
MIDIDRRRFLELTGLSAILAGLAPAGLSAAETKVLRLRNRRDLQVLDPGWMIGGIEIDLQYACLASLAVYVPGEKLSWKPSIFVDKVEAVDDTSILFELKPGILWSDDFGELTAEDVKYSYERIANPANEAPWKDKWRVLDHVEVTGKYSGVIKLKEPFAALWYTTICDGPGCIVSKAAVEKAGGKFTTKFPAVCGPYEVAEWLPQQRVRLTANARWIGPKPVFEQVDILFVEDQKAAELAYEANETDFTEVSLNAFKRLKGNLPAGSKLYEGAGLNWIWLGMNTEHPKLKDIRVRRAIQQAVDVDAIIEAAYAGVAAHSYGIVPPGLIGARTKSSIVHDVAKAKALVDEAGAAGLALDLKVLNTSEMVTAAQVIQANLAEAGLTVNIIPLDGGPFWNLGLESKGEDWKDLQLYINRFGDSPDPSQMAQWYVSEQVGVWNWERWKSPEFDELNSKALVERDDAKRSEMYVRMQEIMEDTGAYVWIAHEPVTIIYRDSLQPLILPPDHPYYAVFTKAG